MLRLEQIKKYYNSELANKFPANILTEYLQYELLDSIFKQKKSENLSFMGGTAIRIIYNGNRFSEDLDFDNFNLSFSEFETIIKNAIIDIEKKGFSVEFRFVKKEAFHCYIRFPQILQQEKLSSADKEKILIRIDSVQRKKLFFPQVTLLNKFNVYRNILANPSSIILSQKMIASISRKRPKGRDFYDISFLYGITKPDFKYIEELTKMKKEEFLDRFKNYCSNLNFNELAKDVEPFLIDGKIERIKYFNDFLKSI